jgi:hypothetical protein
VRYWIVAGTLSLAVAGALVPGLASAESGESDRPQALRLAPHPPHIRTVRATKHDKSRPLREIPPVFPSTKRPHERENPLPAQPVTVLGEDPVVQTTEPATAMPGPTVSFEGLGNVDGYVPPDTNGDVGPSNYVETVNAAFAVYDKSGAKLYGPADINTLWSGFGGLCQTMNDGDPVVQYDQLANRWLIAQFAFDLDFFGNPVGPYYECVAVSTSGDPTGSYYRYAFQISDTKLDDYPKLAVWPDAYYMSVNQFDDSCGLCFVGAAAVAFDRTSMLAGNDASLVYVDLDTNYHSLLPSDLDGSTPPPAGAPDRFVQFDDNSPVDQLEIWNFHVDWATPASSTFTSGGTVATASFDSNMCFGDSGCVQQPSPGEGLDALADRLMYRLAYRHFSDHEAMVVTHTVNVGSDRGGVRWYELRRTTGSWSIFQQSTYAPADGRTRWMGSAAMDQSGDLAVGYSVSSSTTFPGIRYAGRLAGDPLGQLTQGEATLRGGGGAQTDGFNRWGDYSSLDVDPTDDCTFWYANEYYPATSGYDWHTRIGSFKFPSCGPPTTIDGFDPTSGAVGTSVAITGTNLNGATAVKFHGTSATFTVDSPTHVTATVPAGASDGPISVTTPRGTAASAASFDVVVPVPTITGFSPPSGPVGTSVSITGTGLTGATAVTFNGTSATTFSVSSPTAMTATVPAGATTGPIAVTTPGGVATSPSDFTVTVPAPTVSTFSPSSGGVGTAVTVNGTHFDTATSVTFGGVAVAPTHVSASQVRATVPAGAKTGKVGVTNPGGSALSLATFKVLPKLTSFGPSSGAAGASVTIAGSGFTDVSAVKFNGAAGGFGVDSDHQITATVPAAATTGRLSVTTLGGSATSAANFVAVPTISVFAPGSAAPGSAVVVDGTGFGGVSSVKVNGVGAAFSVLSKTQLRLTVPSTATTGAISVTTSGGTATSAATLFVLPRVTSFSPSSAAVGTTVSVYGNAFGGATSVLFGGVLASPLTVSATKITVAVPADAVTGKLTVVTPSGSGQSAGTFKVVPRLSSFSPPSGPAGASVTIAGSGFTSVSAVKFNGVAAASFSVDSSIQITAAVPPTATTGRLTVTTAGGVATSPTSFLAVPTISGFAPGSAAPGTTVLVDGTGFGGVSSVKVNGIGAAFSVLSRTQLRLTVPSTATSGTIAVKTAGGTATSAATLFVLPRVTSFTPSSAAVGATVTLYGYAFGGATSVLFGGVLASPLTVAPTKITVPVPADAVTGKLTVVTPSGSGQSATTFRVVPKLTSFTPSSGPVGTSVTIAGSGFTSVSAAKFNGVAATSFSVDTSSQITATVPAGATTGRVSVATAGGTATSAANFTVTP